MPFVEDGHAVPQRHRFRLVVRHVHRRDAEVGLQSGDVGPHLHAQLRVEVRQRLVHQEHAGDAHDRPPHGDSLALAARKLTGLALEIRGQPQQRRDLLHPLFPLGFLHLRDPQRKADVRRDGEIGVERVVLEDHRDVALLRRHVADVAIADVDGARIDLFQTGEHPERGRLARARRSHEDHELPVVDIEVESVDRRRFRSGVEPGCLDVSHLSQRSPLLPAGKTPPRARGAAAPGLRGPPRARLARAAPRPRLLRTRSGGR